MKRQIRAGSPRARSMTSVAVELRRLIVQEERIHGRRVARFERDERVARSRASATPAHPARPGQQRGARERGDESSSDARISVHETSVIARDEHRVAEREKAVAVRDRVRVGAHRAFVTGEGADEHEQRRAPAGENWSAARSAARKRKPGVMKSVATSGPATTASRDAIRRESRRNRPPLRWNRPPFAAPTLRARAAPSYRRRRRGGPWRFAESHGRGRRFAGMS